MLLPGRHDIDSGGFDAAVAENIRQFRHVFGDLVKRSGEELAQVVREDLGRGDPGGLAERLHLGPDVAAVQRFAAPGPEDNPGGDLTVPRIAEQRLFQFAGQKNGPAFLFAADGYLSGFHRFHGEVFQL